MQLAAFTFFNNLTGPSFLLGQHQRRDYLAPQGLIQHPPGAPGCFDRTVTFPGSLNEFRHMFGVFLHEITPIPKRTDGVAWVLFVFLCHLTFNS
jgi:hypothetical protein